MVFTAYTSEEISAGEPTKQELFQKLSDNFDDHESRITTNGGALNAFLVIPFPALGLYSDFGNRTGFEYFRVTFNMTVTAGRVYVINSGSAGSTEMDLLFDRGAGFAGNSIFDTLPSVAFGAGDNSLSVNAVLNASNKFLEAGDMLRADLTASQTAAANAYLYLEIEKT